jgi:gliding motility-associated lipoprotein GldH
MGNARSILATNLILSIVLFTAGCKDNELHSDTKEFNGYQWRWEDPFTTYFEVSDTSQIYDLNLDLIHGVDYAYQNIYLAVTTEFPGDTSVTTLLPIDLAAKSGRWYGKCNGRKCNLRVYLQENIRFQEPGRYSITFEQYTREDTLDALEKISFKITKPKS